jgi:hypothetical protein
MSDVGVLAMLLIVLVAWGVVIVLSEGKSGKSDADL